MRDLASSFVQGEPTIPNAIPNPALLATGTPEVVAHAMIHQFTLLRITVIALGDPPPLVVSKLKEWPLLLIRALTRTGISPELLAEARQDYGTFFYGYLYTNRLSRRPLIQAIIDEFLNLYRWISLHFHQIEGEGLAVFAGGVLKQIYHVLSVREASQFELALIRHSAGYITAHLKAQLAFS
jgi:hypothetical protein